MLNLQECRAKAYWNRFHELGHRIAEPPQAVLPFRRHQFEASNPVEALIDSVAAEFAFYAPAVRPIVERVAGSGSLSFEAVEFVREEYAPTASLLATVKAVVKLWPRPAAALTAELGGRKRHWSTSPSYSAENCRARSHSYPHMLRPRRAWPQRRRVVGQA